MIEMIFKNKFEFKTTKSYNGKMALDIFKQSVIDNQHAQIKEDITCYDAIILDLNMPIMGGFEACNLMKEFYSKYISHV
jgi:hypothetical protein